MLTREEFEKTYGTVTDPLFALFCGMTSRLDELEAQVLQFKSRLGKNSDNSHKPPSTDGYKKKPVNLRTKSDKKSGGQKGHSGKTLEFSDKPDFTRTHEPSCCGNCGNDLAETPSILIEKRQSFDIPPTKLQCTEHRLGAKYCAKCGKSTRGVFPEEIKHSLQYGTNVTAIVLYLINYQLLTTKRLQELLKDIFETDLSEGTLYRMTKRASETLAPVEEKIKEALQKSEVIHCDETGARINGSLHCIHVVCTLMLTFYHSSKRRGAIAMDEMGILKNFLGTAVHDGWKSYFQYLCKHGLCNVHHLRELKGVFEQTGQTWLSEMTSVLIDAKEAVDKASALGLTAVDPVALLNLETRYLAAIEAGNTANPLPEPTGKKGKRKRTAGGNLVRRLEENQRETLAFLYDFNVPFGNNLAERDIRMVKVKLNISGSFRTTEGAKIFCSIRGYVSTMRKQGYNVLTALRSVGAGKPIEPNYNAT